jgi:hypothetical protein
LETAYRTSDRREEGNDFPPEDNTLHLRGRCVLRYPETYQSSLTKKASPSREVFSYFPGSNYLVTFCPIVKTGRRHYKRFYGKNGILGTSGISRH